MFTCTVGLLSGFGTWHGISVHDPHIHDPGIQYEPSSYVSYLWNTLWRAIPRHMHAGHPVASLHLPQRRDHFLTLFGSHPAAGMEHASSWRIQRAGHLSREEYPLSLSVYYRVGYGYGGKKRLGIWV